jgi:hypothetical protein
MRKVCTNSRSINNLTSNAATSLNIEVLADPVMRVVIVALGQGQGTGHCGGDQESRGKEEFSEEHVDVEQ